MQSPIYNARYAKWLASNVSDAGFTVDDVARAEQEGPEQVLELVNGDEWGFGSAAWFLREVCVDEIRSGLDAGSQQGWEAYLTDCVGTTVTEERTEGWRKAMALGNW